MVILMLMKDDSTALHKARDQSNAKENQDLLSRFPSLFQ
jgi:hypothetical protein